MNFHLKIFVSKFAGWKRRQLYGRPRAALTASLRHWWCSQDRNLRDRDLAQISKRDRGFVIKAETESESWKFETETRDLTFLWWKLKLTPWIMLQQNIWHIAKYQDNKNHPKFVQTAKYCKRSFSLSS